MLKLHFLSLLFVAVHTVASEADFSDETICTDPKKNNCDPNAKCNKVVAGVNADENSPKYFCECIEGYSGDGAKGNCHVIAEPICVLNCDFNTRSMCNYRLGHRKYDRAFAFKFWDKEWRQVHTKTDPGEEMDGYYFLESLVAWNDSLKHHVYHHNTLFVEFEALQKDTRIKITMRTTSENVAIKLVSSPGKATDQNTMKVYTTTNTGWRTETSTLPAGITALFIWASAVEQSGRISVDNPEIFDIRKISVDANC